VSRGAQRGTAKGEALGGFNQSRKEKNRGCPAGTTWQGEVGVRPSVQGSRPAATRKRRPRAGGHGRSKERRWGADVWAHSTVPVGQVKSRSIDFKINLNGFKRFQNRSNFDRLKKDLSELKKFEIKYGFELFEERNNCVHRNVFIFEMYLQLKIWEVKVMFLTLES
jgi:hypothetical protein